VPGPADLSLCFGVFLILNRGKYTAGVDIIFSDFYLEQYTDRPALSDIPASAEQKEDKEYIEMIIAPLDEGDKWTLSYIGFARLQPYVIFDNGY
jgi:hypothetical protein